MNLSKNSNEMKTVVETFVIEETAELIYDNEKLDKWNEHIKELGLTGQTKIVQPTKSPIPFMHMKTSLRNVFQCLCPKKVKVEEYDVTPIPVEILDLIALSKRENYFQEIQIWYDDKSPDPACVGLSCEYYSYLSGSERTGNYKTKAEVEAIKSSNWSVYETNEKYYLLGKWADVKHSFEELKAMATKRFIAEEGNKKRKAVKEAQRDLDDLEQTAFEKFN